MFKHKLNQLIQNQVDLILFEEAIAHWFSLSFPFLLQTMS